MYLLRLDRQLMMELLAQLLLINYQQLLEHL
jgi:hypothetical protein